MKTTEQMLTDAIKRNQELDREIRDINIETLNLKLEIGKLVSDNYKKAYEVKELKKQLEFYTKLNEK